MARSSERRRAFWFAAILVALGGELIGPTHAADYYVAPPPLGGDANPGTLEAPWATLQHAADTVQPGDRILVRAGSYAGAQFTTSGTAELPIELKALPGEEVRITADNPSTPDGIISEAVVEGNVIFDNGESGASAINLDGVQDSVIRNNLLYGNHASEISVYRINGGAHPGWTRSDRHS